LEAGNDIPRLADVLEPFEEGLAPTRCNLDDVVLVFGAKPIIIR
jgi:hypothetical protein